MKDQIFLEMSFSLAEAKRIVEALEMSADWDKLGDFYYVLKNEIRKKEER